MPNLSGGVDENVLSGGADEGGLFGGAGGGLSGGLNFGLFQIPISAFNPTAYAYNAPYNPTTTQTTNSPFSLNLSQTGGPGGAAASSSLFGGLFGGGGGATGGAGGSNIADVTQNNVWAPPNYSDPLAALLGNLGAGTEPFTPFANSPATPNTFNPGMISSPLQGGTGMNVAGGGISAPSPLTALLAGSLAPNSGAAPLASQQGSPVAQALSALMPPGQQGGAPPSMPGGGAASMGFPRNFSALMFPPGPNGEPQQGGDQPPLQSETAQMDTGNGTGPASGPPPVAPQRAPIQQGGAAISPIYSMPKLGRQQELQEHATNAMRDLDDVQSDLQKKLKDAESAGDVDQAEGDLAELDADRRKKDLDADRYTPAQIGGHKHPYLRALGALGMAFQPQSTVANYINQDAQRKFEASKFNAEERYKAAKLNAEVDKSLLTQDRLQEQAAKTRAALAQHRAKTEAFTEAQRKIEAIDKGLGAENIGAKNELANALAQIEVQKLEETQKMNNSLIAYRKAEIETARQNAAAHSMAAGASAQNASTNSKRLHDEEAAGYIPAQAQAKQAYANTANAPFHMGADGELHSPYGVPPKDVNEGLRDYGTRLKQQVAAGIISNDAGRAAYEWYVKGHH